MLGGRRMERDQRPSPEEALQRVQAYIAALRAENVPTALVEERVSDIWAWGQGVRLRGQEPQDVAQRARRCAKSRAGWTT